MSLLVSIEMRGMGRCGAVEMNSVVSVCTSVLFRLSLSESWGRGLGKPIPSIIGQKAGYTLDQLPVCRIRIKMQNIGFVTLIQTLKPQNLTKNIISDKFNSTFVAVGTRRVDKSETLWLQPILIRLFVIIFLLQLNRSHTEAL